MKILAALVVGIAAWSMSFTSYAQSGAVVMCDYLAVTTPTRHRVTQ